MTDLKVNVTDEQIQEIDKRYKEALKLEEHLKKIIYIQRFNIDNLHIIRNLPLFSNHNFNEPRGDIYKV